MKKKVLYSIIVVTLLLVGCSENYNGDITKCTYNKQEAQSYDTVTYTIKHKEDSIDQVIYNKVISASTKEEKENLNTLVYIIQEESKMYAENDGFTFKVNTTRPMLYEFTYVIDVQKVDDNIINPLGIYKNLSEIENYFNTLENIEVKCTKE
ncbi:MAG: hypothetical protein Q4G04_04050 [bacterium]|nr:hypothetical protein [bacterium]